MQGLKVNRGLLFLNLGAINISSTGEAHLAHMLLVNTRLTSLKLHGNHIGDASAAALVDACCVNSTRTSLHCGYNNVSSSAAIKIRANVRAQFFVATSPRWTGFGGRRRI
jgi:hypothetical protein